MKRVWLKSRWKWIAVAGVVLAVTLTVGGVSLYRKYSPEHIEHHAAMRWWSEIGDPMPGAGWNDAVYFPCFAVVDTKRIEAIERLEGDPFVAVAAEEVNTLLGPDHEILVGEGLPFLVRAVNGSQNAASIGCSPAIGHDAYLIMVAERVGDELMTRQPMIVYLKQPPTDLSTLIAVGHK